MNPQSRQKPESEFSLRIIFGLVSVVKQQAAVDRNILQAVEDGQVRRETALARCLFFGLWSSVISDCLYGKRCDLRELNDPRIRNGNNEAASALLVFLLLLKNLFGKVPSEQQDIIRHFAREEPRAQARECACPGMYSPCLCVLRSTTKSTNSVPIPL